MKPQDTSAFLPEEQPCQSRVISLSLHFPSYPTRFCPAPAPLARAAHTPAVSAHPFLESKYLERRLAVSTGFDRCRTRRGPCCWQRAHSGHSRGTENLVSCDRQHATSLEAQAASSRRAMGHTIHPEKIDKTLSSQT